MIKMMQIIGTNFTEVSAKKNKLEGKEIQLGPVQNNVKIEDVFMRPLNVGSIDEAMVFNYLFTSKYTLEKPKDENLGEINILGEIVIIDDKKKMKDTLAAWKKDKKLDEAIMADLLSVALGNAQIEAISMSRKIMLPSPIPLPQFPRGEQPKKAQ
ncbi:MAG: hypothetical protein PHW96_01620 [Candidatus Nanoarchaeia archaeon]|nr:hypothetical protein [Candidatus Nanoarchaeia archaeon]